MFDQKLLKTQRTTELLARMMAEENLIVRYARRSTASFDIMNRILTLPLFDANLSDAVRYGMAAHEIGHALWTPKRERITPLLNVLEDIRIEKMIRSRFRGSAVYMNEMYAELFKDNFFGSTTEAQVNASNFVDRLNIFAKVRFSNLDINIKFSDEEQKIVDKCLLMSTYDDVLLMNKEVLNFVFGSMKPADVIAPGESVEVLEEIVEENDNLEEAEIYPLERDDDEGGNTDHFDDVTPEKILPEEKEDWVDEEEPTLEVASMESFEEASGGLLADAKQRIDRDYLVGDYSDAIQPVSAFVEFITKLEFVPNRNNFKKFEAMVRPEINYLVKQFELRKSADLWAKTQSSKTGQLDLGRIHEYLFADDIFVRDEIQPDGKSHGMVIAIDLSGSMNNMIQSVLKQAAFLALFADKANIPLRIFGFTSGRYGMSRSSNGGIHAAYDRVGVSNVNIIELFNSSTSKKEFRRMVELFLDCDHWFHYISGGTPINETILAMSSEVNRWKENLSLQNVATLLLTDGSGNSAHVSLGVDSERVHASQLGEQMWLDITTKKKYDASDRRANNTEYSACVEIFKDRTGASFSTMFIGSRGDIRNHLRWGACDYEQFSTVWDKISAGLRQEPCFAVDLDDVNLKNIDAFFVMVDNDLIETVDAMEIKEGSAAKSSFLKKARARSKSKVFANKFVELLA